MEGFDSWVSQKPWNSHLGLFGDNESQLPQALFLFIFFFSQKFRAFSSSGRGHSSDSLEADVASSVRLQQSLLWIFVRFRKCLELSLFALKPTEKLISIIISEVCGAKNAFWIRTHLNLNFPRKLKFHSIPHSNTEMCFQESKLLPGISMGLWLNLALFLSASFELLSERQ